MDDGEGLSARTYGLALAAIVAVALALRLAGFGSIPPGLYHDEAYNGLDALQVLQGERPLWFAANNGREPLFIYLVALSVAALGRTVAAVRAPALLLGLLTVPATAFLGESLFSRRVGLLAAAVTAITFWPLHLSRVGFRAVGLPLTMALALGFLWRGLRHGRRWQLAAGGLFYGLGFYIYLAARSTPLPLLALGLLALWPAARLPRPGWREVAIFAGPALLAVAPLAVHLALQPGMLAGRLGQVSILNPAISHGDPVGTLARHTGRALQALLIRGDRIPRHNLPWRPIFDPALGVAFVAGVIVALRRRAAGWFVLLWVGAMLLPTILAEDAPHFLRAVGVQPVIFILPALGLDSAMRRLAAAGHRAAGLALTGLVLIASLASTGEAYFRRYAHDPAVYYHFEAGSTELANAVLEFLADAPAPGARVAYVSQRLWDDWPSLRFLLPEGADVQVVSVDDPPEPAAAAEALLVAWPFERYQPALALLPSQATLTVGGDLFERGDLDPEARQLALLFAATRHDASAPQAIFERGIGLVEATVEPAGAQELEVRLVWQAGEALSVDYTVFVQVLRDSSVLGQDDRQPAGGLLPTTLWQPGQQVVDLHRVDLPTPYNPETDRVIVGLYELASMARLPIIASELPVAGDAILVSTS